MGLDIKVRMFDLLISGVVERRILIASWVTSVSVAGDCGGCGARCTLATGCVAGTMYFEVVQQSTGITRIPLLLREGYGTHQKRR